MSGYDGDQRVTEAIERGARAPGSVAVDYLGGRQAFYDLRVARSLVTRWALDRADHATVCSHALAASTLLGNVATFMAGRA